MSEGEREKEGGGVRGHLRVTCSYVAICLIKNTVVSNSNPSKESTLPK